MKEQKALLLAGWPAGAGPGECTHSWCWFWFPCWVHTRSHRSISRSFCMEHASASPFGSGARAAGVTTGCLRKVGAGVTTPKPADHLAQMCVVTHCVLHAFCGSVCRVWKAGWKVKVLKGVTQPGRGRTHQGKHWQDGKKSLQTFSDLQEQGHCTWPDAMSATGVLQLQLSANH